MAASGCMVVSEKAVFTASNKVEMPDISGAFTDPDKGTFILKRNEGATNSFTLTSPDKKDMTLIFEPLPTKDRYVVQAANPAGPEVLLGLCVIANHSVDLYAIKPAEIAALTKKHGLTINEKGIITTQNPSKKTLLNFFNDSFDPKYSVKVTSIQPGSAKDAKDAKSGKKRADGASGKR